MTRCFMASVTGSSAEWPWDCPDLPHPVPTAVVVLLHDIQDVNVEEEKVRYFGRGFVVVLRSATGFSHPLTQSAVMGHRR